MMSKDDKNIAVVEYDEIVGKHPITGETTLVKIEKPKLRSPEEMAAHTKAQLAMHGLEPVSQVELEDPITGKKSLVTLDRTGYQEVKLIAVLADPNLTRERKDHELSMYMWERGGESASMMVDLIRYKGQHTKQSHVFQSQIRFDFEAFLSTFCISLEDQVDLASKILGIDVRQTRDDFYDFVAERIKADKEAEADADANYVRKEYTVLDYLVYKDKEPVNAHVRMWALQIALAIHAYDTASLIRKRIDSIKDARERVKGKGIYLSAAGRPYTLNDPDLDDIIKADREATEEIKKS